MHQVKCYFIGQQINICLDTHLTSLERNAFQWETNSWPFFLGIIWEWKVEPVTSKKWVLDLSLYCSIWDWRLEHYRKIDCRSTRPTGQRDSIRWYWWAPIVTSSSLIGMSWVLYSICFVLDPQRSFLSSVWNWLIIDPPLPFIPLYSQWRWRWTV